MKNGVILESVGNLAIIAKILKLFGLRLARDFAARGDHWGVGRSYVSLTPNFTRNKQIG